MGGMQDMGPTQYEENEPVFHARWEARVFALNVALGAWRKWNLDAARYELESIPPAEYLRNTYYERWLTRLIALLVKSGIVTRAEIESGTPSPSSPKAVPALTASAVPKVLAAGNPKDRDTVVGMRFKVGERVRARNINPVHHTRLPRYARGKIGTIQRDHGVYVFPDTNAQSLGENPQHLYSVRFGARELWGEQASPHDAVHLDLWEDYLERA